MLELFLTFAKIGMFTFGGGYAMVAIIENVCVEEKKWITHRQMLELTVIAESTPGPIAINCATYVGWKRGGLPGAVAATIGMVLPSFVIICLIAMFLDNFLEIPLVANAFRGIRVGVGVLILNAGLKMHKKLPKTLLSRLLLGAGFGALLVITFLELKISTFVLLAAAGAVGVTVCAVKGGEGA